MLSVAERGDPSAYHRCGELSHPSEKGSVSARALTSAGRFNWSAVVADGSHWRVSLPPVPDKTMNPFGIRVPLS